MATALFFSTKQEDVVMPDIPIKGDRVILTDERGRYNTHRSNPHWHSDYGCVGTVIETEGGVAFRVKWDNGTRNSYALRDLSLYSASEFDENNPNRAYKIEKWNSRKVDKDAIVKRVVNAFGDICGGNL